MKIAAQFKSKKTFDDSKAGTGTKAPRVDELVDTLKLPPNEWISGRFVGPAVSYGIHWIETVTKDGKKTSFPAVCLAYDAETEETDSTHECPWCDADLELIRFSPEYYSNFIVRQLQEDEPNKKAKHTDKEKKSGFKEKGSKSWTPARAMRLTRTLIRELKKLGQLNRVKNKATNETKAFPLSHPKFGCDVSIMYDPNEKTPSKKYSIQKGERTPLSEEEQEYLLWNIEGLMSPLKLAEANKEFERWAEKMDVGSKKKKKGKKEEDSSDDDDDDDDDEDTPKGKGKKSKSSKKPSKSDDDDDDDDSSDDDDDDDDEEDKKSSKKKDKKSKASEDDDDDDDDSSDDDDDDDDDEDEKKSSKKKPAKGKKKPKDEDDDDDDDDSSEDDDEDEEDKPVKGKKKSKDEDDSDDDDDDLDDDDDDDDEEDKKSSKKSKDKKSKGKKKAKDDDDDDDDSSDDDDDDDLDDDEDEKKSSKKKAKGKDKGGKKGKKKAKSDDDFDDDDD